MFTIIRKLKNHVMFLLEQKYAIIEPRDKFTISKGSFRKYLPKNPVIIDCGAHIGADSIELSKIFPNAQIHSFEPVPGVFEQLSRGASSYKNIFRHQLALSNENKKSKMFVSSMGSDGSSSLLPPKTHLEDHPNVLFEEVIEINAKTLDTWAKENNITHVDLLWLDMQGFEYQALEASPKILATVKVIHTEVSIKETYEGVLMYSSFKKWLQEQGFEAVKEVIPEGTDMGNVVFVRSKV
ncbi:MAG: FkbM family methyltransferase [Bacteroidia bacterium]